LEAPVVLNEPAELPRKTFKAPVVLSKPAELPTKVLEEASAFE
jgi:hypothetical protein